jgi:pimeloyl-[acyl-carrier protein] methyl ester esterase
MPDRPTLVVLPGLDGSDALLPAFKAAAESDFEVRVVCYPADRCLGYADLVGWLWPRLPTQGPWILLGESFGGPLAVQIAARQPPGLQALVLCASFARYPWLRLLRPLIPMIPMGRPPALALSLLLFGAGSPHRPQIDALRRVLRETPAAVLHHRLRALLAVDVRTELAALRLPVLILRARYDRLVPAAAGRELLNAAPTARLLDISSPHAMLATAPAAVAGALAGFRK